MKIWEWTYQQLTCNLNFEMLFRHLSGSGEQFGAGKQFEIAVNEFQNSKLIYGGLEMDFKKMLLGKLEV